MIGLLALTALPTTIAVAEGISSQTRAAESARRPPDEKLMRKFRLRCYCAAPSKRSAEVHGGLVVVRDGMVWILPPSSAASDAPFHAFEGFYVLFPDEERPRPLPLGLVTTVADDPPMLNWVYVDASSGEVRTGNRTQSRRHRVGDWGWVLDDDDDGGGEGGKKEEFLDEDEEGGGGGLTLDGGERFVVVEPEGEGEGGLWQVWWDEGDEGLKGGEGVGGRGRRVLRVSLEREFVEGGEGNGKEGKGKGGGGGKEGGKGGKEGGKGKVKGAVKVELEDVAPRKK